MSIGEALIVPPPEPPIAETVALPQQQEAIAASSSDYSNSEDEYTHIEEPTPVSDRDEDQEESND